MHSQSNSRSTIFENRGLDELIPYLGRGFHGATFGELADAYQRILEIVFHDVTTSNEDRAQAAAWANVLESLIILTLVGHEQLILPLMDARNMSKQNAEKYGYGSIGWVAIHDSKNIMNRIWPDNGLLQDPERFAVNERRKFLLSVVFGREVDASNRVG